MVSNHKKRENKRKKDALTATTTALFTNSVVINSSMLPDFNRQQEAPLSPP